MKNGKLDLIDQKIIAQLDLNARATYLEIGKNIGLSKNAVRYRISNLEKIGIIKGYCTYSDFIGLGYSCYRVYISFNSIDPKVREKMICELKKSDLVWWLNLFKGNFDLCCIFWSKGTNDFFDFWREFRINNREKIKGITFAPFFGYELNLLPNSRDSLKTQVSQVIGPNTNIKVDSKDEQIIRLLSKNARIPLMKIGKAVGLTPAAVKYRMDRLINDKIIICFKPVLDMDMLSLKYYKVDFNLRSAKRQKEIENYLVREENFFHIIRALGWADIESCGYFSKSAELDSALDRIQKRFPDDIISYKYNEISEIMKESYFPEF